MLTRIKTTAKKTASAIGNTAQVVHNNTLRPVVNGVTKTAKVVRENWDPLWGMVPYARSKLQERKARKADKTRRYGPNVMIDNGYHYEG